MIVVISLSAK